MESNEVGRKESITIDIEAGESSDLVEEVLNLFKYFLFAHRINLYLQEWLFQFLSPTRN